MNRIGRPTEALKRWADEHREWIIIGVALPAGTAAGAVDRVKSWFRASPKPSDHDKRVLRIRGDVARYADARKAGEVWAHKPLRTDRKGAASLNVRMSDKSASLGGFLHTYCDVFSTEEEFLEMFDHTPWWEMRAKHETDGAFPTIYEKVKPETDPLGFLDEERSWSEG